MTQRVRVESGQKRVRGVLAGEVIVDTDAPLLVWEKPYYPTYYFPEADVKKDAFVDTGETRRSPSRGEAAQYVVKVNGSEGTAYTYPTPKIEELAGYYAFVWNTMDHWFEEDEEVFVHPRDPYTRIDILPSSRRVRIEIDGVTVADTTNASFLFETGLPVRYYLPKTDVRMDLMKPTETRTHCPYKGTARYWSAEVNGETYVDILWGYDSPLPESQKVVGQVSFYNEKVDVFVDEEPMERPKTKFA